MSDSVCRFISKFVIAVLLFIAGFVTYWLVDSKPAELDPDGVYSVMFVRKTFSARTGKPTYYILASPMVKMHGRLVDTQHYRLYEVTRDKISNVQNDNKPDDRPTLWLHMANGSGAFLSEPLDPL